MKRYLLAVLCLLGTCFGQGTIKGQVVTIAGSGNIYIFVIQGVSVSAPSATNPANPTITAGATLQFVGQFFDANGDTVPACTNGHGTWTSSTPAVATINASTGLASGVAVGSTTITCTDQGKSGTALLNVVLAPNFTNPNPSCTQPCPLTGGNVGVAYGPYSMTGTGGASGGYTCSLTAGSLPAGLVLSNGPGGANCNISGTPTGPAATTIFSVQICDSLSNCSSALQVSIAITANSCGPNSSPAYNCSQHGIGNATWLAPPLMGPAGCVPNCTTGVNTTGYAYSQPTDYFYPTSGSGNCYSRITDANSNGGKSMALSGTGGPDIFPFDISGQYMVAINSKYFVVSISLNANGCLQVNNPNLVTNSVSFTNKAPVWSLSAPATLWTEQPGPVTVNSVTYQIPLYKHVVSGTTTVTSVDTVVFDYQNCPGLPAIPLFGGFPPAGAQISISELVNGHELIATAIGDGTTGSGQNHANWLVAYDTQTGGCATRNIVDGRNWAFCVGNCSQSGTNPAPLGTVNLLPPGYTEQGDHDSQVLRDPAYMRVTTHAIKTSDGSQHNNIEWWQVGTNNAVAPFGIDKLPDGHPISGYDAEGAAAAGNGFIGATLLPPVFAGNTYSVLHFLNFAPGGGVTVNSYGAWTQQLTQDDTGPMVFVVNPVSGTYPPTFFQFLDEIDIATQQPNGCVSTTNPTCQASRIGPSYNNFNLNQPGHIVAIPNTNGTCIAFNSNWAGNLGLDSSGKVRYDVFAICNLQ